MAKHIYKCSSCEKYTLEEKCSCGGKAIFPRPPKFSLNDKYVGLRRKVRKEELEKKGLVWLINPQHLLTVLTLL